MNSKTLKILSRIAIANFLGLTLIIFFVSQSGATQNQLESSRGTKNITEKKQDFTQSFDQLDFNETLDDTKDEKTQPEPEKEAQDPYAEVSLHNTPDDCWIVIEGRIYDISTYFGRHPGGDAELMQSCGKDASEGFGSKGKSPAQDHSAAAYAMLEQFRIY